MSVLYPQPLMRPIADSAVLVEFGSAVDDLVHQAVLDFDATLNQTPVLGLIETVPAFTSVMISYNCLVTDFDSLCDELRACLGVATGNKHEPERWDIPVCYQGRFAPDLPEFADRLGLEEDDVIKLHQSVVYKVYLYGFAPGFAYLGGGPEKLQLPRKEAPVKDVPSGTIILAGQQALITTVVMPSGWWQIGRTHKTPLQPLEDRQFLFNVGDNVKFVEMGEEEFIRLENTHSRHGQAGTD